MAFYLAENKALRVLVVDMDVQGNTSSRLAPRSKDDNGNNVDHYSGTRTAELFGAGKLKIQAMKCPAGMDLIHTPRNDPDLAEVEELHPETAENPAKHLAEFAKNSDYVLIDCTSSLGRKLVGDSVAQPHVVCPHKLYLCA